MRSLLKPRWIFIVNTLPILILLFICFGEFQIIKSMLDKLSTGLWIKFGLALLVMGFLNFVYAVYLEIKKQQLSVWYGIVTLVAHISFLYVYAFYAEKIIPFNIPRWMFSENIMMYVGTFLMPTLAFALMILIVKLTPESVNHKAWKSFLIAVIIPIIWYIFSQLVTPFWKIIDTQFGLHAMIIFFIAGTLLFLFFLARSVYVLGLKKGEKWSKFQLIWKIPISVIFPILGLLLNNGLLTTQISRSNDFIFGNYSNIWFYVIAILNGLFICLPNLENKIYRIILFICRSLTFAYTFYFFLVFLPFLPLSIAAVVIFGAGFLMLTPLVLFIIHLNELSKDFVYFKNYFQLPTIYGISALAFMVLPMVITVNNVHHKRVLNQALEYIYNPDFSKTYHIDKKSLRRTLDEVAQHKKRNRDIIFGNYTPYLSAWFSYIVLDNMTISDSKQYRIENVFFDKNIPENQLWFDNKDTVYISDVKSTSNYDKNQQAWISQVDLELTSRDSTTWTPAEYSTSFELPEGCYISDYYLYVGDKKESGILAEKKAAMWVFQQIRDTRRDPGILYYTNGNKVVFRVFPFATNEVRKTGIEFIHKEPFKLRIDSNIIELGNRSEQSDTKIVESTDKNVVYIPASEKLKLPLVQREPYYHFLIDVSKGEKEHVEKNITLIDNLLKNNPLANKEARISFVGADITTCSNGDDWKPMLRGQYFEDGFFLDRAIKKLMIEAYQNKSKTYPVFVVLSSNIGNAIIDDNYADYQNIYPESKRFYQLKDDGKLAPHSLIKEPLSEIYDTSKTDLKPFVRAYPSNQNPVAWLPNDSLPSIVLKNELFKIEENQIKPKDWTSALAIQGKYISQTLHPEIAEDEWLNLVKYSFMSKIMNPFTSYMVVETEAQKAVLKKKQEQVLSGGKNLDLTEDARRMSEPELFLMLILFGVFLWIRKTYK